MKSDLRQQRLVMHGGALRRESSDSHAQTNGLFGAILNAMPCGLLLVNGQNRIVYANAVFTAFCKDNLGSEHILGRDAEELLGELDADDQRRGARLPPCEIQTRGSRIISCVARPIDHLAAGQGAQLWVFDDVTQERALASQLLYHAEHDFLTGLYNRHRFQEELSHQIRITCRHERPFALLFIDLDNFKAINDSLGHRTGDLLLKRVADGLASLVRGDEFLARLGGDEFAILAPATDEREIQVLAERIQQGVTAVAKDFLGGSTDLSCSIGIVVYPRDGCSETELLARADMAMYQVKANNGSGWRWWQAQRPDKMEGAR